MLEEGMKYVRDAITPKDAELLAGRKFTVEEIARDTSQYPSARVTAVRTLREIAAAEGVPLRSGFDGLDELGTRRAFRMKAGASRGETPGA